MFSVGVTENIPGNRLILMSSSVEVKLDEERISIGVINVEGIGYI